jgi:hypothetical protein
VKIIINLDTNAKGLKDSYYELQNCLVATVKKIALGRISGSIITSDKSIVGSFEVTNVNPANQDACSVCYEAKTLNPLEGL